MIELRPYQQQALDAIWAYFRSPSHNGNPLIVAPTGSGKSLIIAGFCKHVQKNWPEQRILILSHVKEILVQNQAAIQSLLPAEIKVGIYVAGLNHKDIAPITLASIQSAYNAPEQFAENFDIVLVDECHLIPHRGTGRYRTLLQQLGKPTVGFTATPFRLGTGYLHIGEGALFDQIIYNIRIKDLIEMGHLCPVAAKGTRIPMDPTDIRKSGGDYVVKALADRFDKTAITENIVQELLVYKRLRKKWLLFAIDIEHANHITQTLNQRGIVAESVHSKMKGNRAHIIQRFKTDPTLQALVSVAVLTTGFDAPETDLIGLLRPTASPVLHVQIIGRGLRPAPGKADCLVLDFAGNLLRNGPIDNPDIRVAGNGTGEPIMKQCPECFEIVYSAVKNCPVCGHEFLFRHHLHSDFDGASNVLSAEAWHKVDFVDYESYLARSNHLMLKVFYNCGLRQFTEYIAVEHTGYARYRAEHWWQRRLPNSTLPPTVEEALPMAAFLKQPTEIFVDESGKYPNIKKQKFQ